MTFNGRIHSQRKYLRAEKYEIFKSHHNGGRIRSRIAHAAAKPNITSGNRKSMLKSTASTFKVSLGSVNAGGGTVGGPNISGSIAGQRGYFPDSPNGVAQSELGNRIGQIGITANAATVSAVRY